MSSPVGLGKIDGLFVQKDRNGLIIEIALTVSSMRMIVSISSYGADGISAETRRGRGPLHDLSNTAQPGKSHDRWTGDAGHHSLWRAGDGQPQAGAAAIDPGADRDRDGKLSGRLTPDCCRRRIEAAGTRAHRRIGRHQG